MFKPVSSRLDEDKDRVCYMYSMLWMTAGEIAENLGYASCSSVQRALRRWGVLRTKEEQLADLKFRNTGCKRTAETRKHVSEGVKRSYINNPGLRNERSSSNKACWDSMSDEDKAKRYSKGLKIMQLHAQQAKVSSIELKVKRQLEELGVRFIHQKQIADGKFILDFYIPSIKLVVECNGDYWHNLEDRKQRDRELKEYVLSTGRDIIFIWEHEINDEWFWIGDYIFGDD